jgi:hypothetical protein
MLVLEELTERALAHVGSSDVKIVSGVGLQSVSAGDDAFVSGFKLMGACKRCGVLPRLFNS